MGKRRKPAPGTPRDLGRLVLAALRAWVRHRAPSKGAALAFYTLFSMTPILVLVMAIAGHFIDRQAVQGEILAQMEALLGTTGAAAVQSLLAEARLPGAGRMATWLATLLLVVGATSVFAELKDSLDDIWNIQAPGPQGLFALIRARVLSFGLVLVLAFLLLVTMVVNAALALVTRAWDGHGNVTLLMASVLSQAFAFTVIVALFAVIYKMLPEVKLSWRDVSIGAVSTATLFTLGKHLIGAYLGSGALGSGYGAAGALIALLIWIYYSAQIFFLGAEFTREYALAFGSLRSLHQSE